ncbi:hypothetical protein GOQ30_05050 [Flavobacterium sp. TP390]|uniref:Uncharacterized protein n=1 Tax=Flavobacterium profundi TaxID=1774945 RepID=A0A6I4IKD8_9FLAO|nr:hypothetical protein [Flavobacterium profundi]MVO08531.1 hypothetical protein [Flavobacterium profundi]
MNFKEKITFASFEDLENHLKNCIHWYSTENVGQFDTVGITILLNALVENLRKNTSYTTSKDLKNILSQENRNYLLKMLE